MQLDRFDDGERSGFGGRFRDLGRGFRDDGLLGFVWQGDDFRGGGLGDAEAAAVLVEVEKGIAVLAVMGELVAAEEIHAVDVVAVRREGWVVEFFGVWLAGLAGEGLPGLDEVEGGVVGGGGVVGADVGFLEVDLGVDEGGFESGEAGLAPSDTGELVDDGLFVIVAGFDGIA